MLLNQDMYLAKRLPRWTKNELRRAKTARHNDMTEKQSDKKTEIRKDIEKDPECFQASSNKIRWTDMN